MNPRAAKLLLSYILTNGGADVITVAATVYIGLKPDVLLDWIIPALQSPFMQAALKGGSL